MSLLWVNAVHKTPEDYGIKQDEDPPNGPWDRGPRYSDEWDHAEIEEVPIDENLRATQSYIDPKRLDHYLKGGQVNQEDIDEGRDLPRVSHEDGKNFIIDGHHRVISDKIDGHDSFNAYVHYAKK